MRWLLIIVLFQVPAFALAAPATFTVQAIGSGYLGGTPFTNSPVTITGFGDTSNRFPIPWGTGLYIIHDSATVSVGSIGEFAITMPTRTFVNNGNSIVGFGNGYEYGTDILNGPVNTSFATWDLGSSLGPFTGPGVNNIFQVLPISTSGGVLNFSSLPTTITFTAIVVPEPGSICLYIGTMALLAFRRQR
jgi:hypothetical protein